MTTTHLPNPIRLAALIVALTVATAAQANVLYSFNYSDTGKIQQDGTALSFAHDLSNLGGPITSVQIILTFQNSLGLTGDNSGIQGLLTLGTTESSPSYSFQPVATSSGSGGQKLFNVTFNDLNSYDPNATWALVLYDKGNSGMLNTLQGWSLNVEVVPETSNIALVALACMFVCFHITRWYRQRFHRNGA